MSDIAENLNGEPPEKALEKPDGRGKSEGSRKHQFGPGGKRREETAALVMEAPTTPHDFDLVGAMRHVLSAPKAADRTTLDKECREWLKENRSAFMAKLVDLTKLEQPSPKPRDEEKELEKTEELMKEEWEFVCKALRELRGKRREEGDQNWKEMKDGL